MVKEKKEQSWTDIIIRVLKLKSIKSVEAAIKKIDEIKPGRSRTKSYRQIYNIIYRVKHQTGGKWNKYHWDTENFLLTEK